MEYKREELIALMREMANQTALCHISPRLAGEIVKALEEKPEDMIPKGDMEIILGEVVKMSKPEWISVKDRLPKEDGDYLCYCPVLQIGGKDIPRYEVYGFTLDAESLCDLAMVGEKGAAWYWYDSEYGYCRTRSVTHWMLPPEPPELRSENGR